MSPSDRQQRHVRVVIAGGRCLLRDALANLLNDTAGLEVVGSTREVLATEAVVAREGAHVVVAHVHVGEDGGGVELAVRLRTERPDVGVVLLIGDGDISEVHRVLESGTSRRALLMMDHPRCARDLVDAITEVATGGSIVHPEVVELVVRARDTGRLGRLTPTESAVLHELAAGRSNVAIAASLGLSPRAVEKRIGLLYDKLDLPQGPDVHRRVLATLVQLRGDGQR